MSKLKMLQPRLKTLDVAKAMGIKMVKTPRAKATGRDADPRRTLPLNSAAWQRLRAFVLAGEPLCRMCTAAGMTVIATDVDHRDGDPGNNDATNLQPLCHSCHSRKTAGDHGKRVSMGCDGDGIPLDPAHPWRQAVDAQKSRATDGARPTGSSRFTPNSDDL